MDISKDNTETNKVKKYLLPGIFLFIVVIIWHYSIRLFNIAPYLIPSPMEVVEKAWEIKGSLLIDSGITMIEAVLGFLLGSAVGIILAVSFLYSKSLELSVFPFTIAIKSIPIIALAPLLVLWFGNEIISKIIISSLVCFFPIIVNSVKGLRSVEREALDLFDSLSATRNQIFFKLLLPTSLPYIFAALKISTTFAVVGAIVGEFAGARRGLGFFILQSSYWMNTADIFVSIILISILSILFYGIISVIEKYAMPWQVHYLKTL